MKPRPRSDHHRSQARPDLAAAPTFFATAAAFREWLEANHSTTGELFVGFYKVSSGRPSMSWPESVDEALCFGWIDGVRKRIDDESYQIRFTPRRVGSVWSHVNVAKAEHLMAQGRMQPTGIAAYEARKEDKTGVYAFEREQPAELSDNEVRAFKKNKPAWSYFESAAPGYRKVIVHWVVSAKRATTRERRLSQLIQACAERKRIVK